MLGFVLTQGDAIAFQFSGVSNFFTGASLAGDFNDSGHVKGTYIVINDVDGAGHYSGSPGTAAFVLDTVGFSGAIAALYFDANGNGDVLDAGDVKVTTFDVSSNIAGIQNTNLLLI